MYRSHFPVFPLAILLIPFAAVGHAATNRSATKYEIVADDMCCKGCAQKVAAQLYAAPGVTSVEADVPNRRLVITAKPSQKLTPERLWKAVEQGKGGPSKLTTSDATYVFAPNDKLQPQQRLSAGRYAIVIRGLQSKDSAQQIANGLYAEFGFKRASVDVAKSTLLLQARDESTLSLWHIATVVRKQGAEPVSVTGPSGKLTIEWAQTIGAETAARVPYSPIQGGIR